MTASTRVGEGQPTAKSSAIPTKAGKKLRKQNFIA